ncbi:MAG: NAD-dependent epimerase [Gammaproteobacteria bacterium]|nr:NAD-dependent epimerase [Gammaproteobacteria bacterium]
MRSHHNEKGCLVARIVVTGGGGFLGQRLIGELLESDRWVINGDHVSIESLCVIDRVIPEHFRARGVETIEGDLLSIIRERHEIFEGVDAVIHLASAVSGECEADLELGLEVNLNAGMALGRRLAQENNKPLLVFSSSLAVYGGTPDFPLPPVITDDIRPNPQNSYGAQKLTLETLYADLARRGLISIRTLRLMTVSVRPGAPNQAASGFLSGMIREPLAGIDSNIPVPLETEVALNSPKQAVDGLIRVMGISDEVWGSPLGLNLPGIRISVQGMIDALEAVAGREILDHLTCETDPAIQRIVAGWPSCFDSTRAQRLRLESNERFETVVRDFSDTK